MSVPQLAENIGMTKGGLYAAIENNTLSVKTLEKIAEVFNVPITSFFEDDSNELSKSSLIAEVKKNEKTISEFHDNCLRLIDIQRAKRSSLRLILMNVRSTQDLIKQNFTNTDGVFVIDVITKIANSLKGIDLAINDSEHFDDEESMLPERQEVGKTHKHFISEEVIAEMSRDRISRLHNSFHETNEDPPKEKDTIYLGPEGFSKERSNLTMKRTKEKTTKHIKD